MPEVRIQAGDSSSLSIVLPVYNERAAIGGLVSGIVVTLREAGVAFEVVAVDDGSTDGTFDVLCQKVGEFPESLRVVRHLTNKGNGASLRTGIQQARGAIVVTMDADGQHAPEDILRLAREIPPHDLVIGARTLGYRGSRSRGWANAFFNRFASWLCRTRIEDLTSGFRAMRREVALHFLPLFPSGYSAPTTTTMAFLKAGYNVLFVPVPVAPRASGESKVRPLEDGARFVTIILRMIMLYDPLRIFLPVGIGLVALGVLAEIAGLIQAQRLVLANSAVFLFTAALLTWLLGLISDQVSSSRISYHGDESLIVVDDFRDAE